MKKILLNLLFVFFSVAAFAQERTIEGVVTGKDDGLPIPNVSIRVKGTNVSTQTSSNGTYAIKIPNNNAVLMFSYLGYITQERTADTNRSINITLAFDEKTLNEVTIVTPYGGRTTKETFTGSAAQINSSDFKDRPITNVLNAVVGAAPGIQTTSAGGAPGSAPAIRIRGFGSLNASSSALYVVDNMVYDGAISSIDPDDVESITLLKDAATIALYGSRGANGVVMITTKKGKANVNTLSFKANTGWISRGLPEYDRLNANDYYPIMWEVQRNTLQYGGGIPRDIANGIASGTISSYNGTNYSSVKTLLGYNPFNVPDNQIVTNGQLNPNASLLYPDDLNWAEQAMQGGKQRQNYNITYSGGNGKSDYYGSVGYTNEESYLLVSNLKRYNGRLAVNTNPVSWFKTGLNLAGSYSTSSFDNTSGSTSFINPFYISRFIGPIYPVHLHDAAGNMILDANGQPRYDFGDARPFAQGRHTIFENLNDTQRQVRGTINARNYATINFTKDLRATSNVSLDLQDTHEREYDNIYIGDGAPAGRSYHGFYRTTTITFNQFLEYSKTIGKHNFDITAGHESYKYKYNSLNGSKSGQSVDGITELPNFATILGTASSETNGSIESYISRLNYDFEGKYLVSANYRRDGNSKFSEKVRWADFYGFGLGWNIHKESFFNLSWIDRLKLRTAYGQLGNDGGLSWFSYQALYSLGNNNQSEAGFRQSALQNDDLTWETGKNFDVALEFSLFKSRLTGAVEYFNKVTDGLIFSVQQPLSNGGTTGSGNFSIPTNIGTLSNKGIELQLTGQVVKTKELSYTATLNLTKFKNEITKMPPTQPFIQSGTKAYSVGHSIYDFYLREFYGVDPENGNALYKTNAISPNTKIIGTDTVTTVITEADYRYTGNSSIPDLFGSMLNTFNYKNITLSVLTNFQLGGKIYDSSYASLMHGANYGTALHSDILNRWQQPGDLTSIPRLDNGQVVNFTGGSTRWLTNASYLQLTNVTLSYALPKSWISKIGSKNASIFASGENLALLSARKGMDVTGSFGGTVSNSYNFNRTISLGFNINF